LLSDDEVTIKIVGGLPPTVADGVYLRLFIYFLSTFAAAIHPYLQGPAEGRGKRNWGLPVGAK
jgi:hypothetical protein